jgi:hypothetical protein
MEENSPPNVRTLGGREYTLRQTRPDQVTTHWDTCYTLHSACMEWKVERDAQEIAALRKGLERAAIDLMGFQGFFERDGSTGTVASIQVTLDLVDALLAQPVTPGEAP